MKAIIDRRRYDTETATRVARYSNGGNDGDFHTYAESLYRTPKGTWFTAGRGGALSPYGERFGRDMRGPGSAIRPLAEEEARAWLEDHGEVALLEELFGSSLLDA